MKIIFLDIDGVLNSETSYRANLDKGISPILFSPEEEFFTHDQVQWDQDNVDNLRFIVDHTGAQMILSSSWGHHFPTEAMIRMFPIYGWLDVPLIGQTPKKLDNNFRGNEIDMALEKWPNISNYIILDDCEDFYPHHKRHLLKTNDEFGLTEIDSMKAVEMLNSNESRRTI